MGKRFVKLGVIILVMVILFTMVTSCGKIKEDPSNVTNAPSTGTDDTNTNETNEMDETEPELKPVKLIWYTVMPEQKDQELVFEQFSEKIKEEINAEVDIRPFDFGNYEEKLNIVIASGEPFDVCWTSDWCLNYVANVTKGAFMPIDELLLEYAPQTKEFYADKFWELTKVDGKLYGVPCYQTFYRQPGYWIKKDIAEKYNFDPSTVTTEPESLTPFLKKVKEGEPDLTPIVANGPVVPWFGKSMGIYSQEYADNVVNGQAPVCVYESDPTKVRAYDEDIIAEFKSAMKVAREWYTEGYVRSDLLSIKDYDAEVKTGKYAMGFGMYSPTIEVDFADRNGFEVVAYPLGEPVLSGVTATLMAISATSENPERAMMFIDLLQTNKEVYNLICNGIDGKHYVKTEENRIKRVEDNGYQPNMDWAMGNTSLSYLKPGQPDNMYEIIKEGNDAAKPSLLPGYSFDNSNVKNEIAALEQVNRELETPMWAGVLDPEENFPKLIERLEKAGIRTVEAEAQRQVDAYWEARK